MIRYACLIMFSSQFKYYELINYVWFWLLDSNNEKDSYEEIGSWYVSTVVFIYNYLEYFPQRFGAWWYHASGTFKCM